MPAATGGLRTSRALSAAVAAIMVVVALVLLIACATSPTCCSPPRHRATAGAEHPQWRSRVTVANRTPAPRRELLLSDRCDPRLRSRSGAAPAVASALDLRQQRFPHASIDWRILGFTRPSRSPPRVVRDAPALRGTRVRRTTRSKRETRQCWRDPVRLGSLSLSQVALSLVLVVAAGLFVRRSPRSATRDPASSATRCSSPVSPRCQRSGVGRALRVFPGRSTPPPAVPGVESAALSAVTPVSGSAASTRIEVAGWSALPGRPHRLLPRVSAGWFRTYGTPSWPAATS